MKLNPFNRKTHGYFDRMQAEYQKLGRELTAMQEELADATADLERKESACRAIERQSSIYSFSNAERQSRMAESEAKQRVHRLKSEIMQLESQIAPLKRIALAPQQQAEVNAQLADLLSQAKATDDAWQKTLTQISKLEKRIAELESRIAAETQSATTTLLEAEGDFAVPEALTRLEVEMRLAATSLTGLRSQQQALQIKRQELPKAISDAQRDFQHCRVVTSEIELYEQLQPLMPLLARASATKGETDYHHNKNCFEIEIPSSLIQAAQTVLAAELPKA